MTFFEKYSYKQKNFALLVLAVLLFAAAYKRSFKTTLETRAYISELEQKQLAGQQSQHELFQARKEVMQLNKLLGKENVSIEKTQQAFLNFFAAKSAHISVQQIDEVYSFEHPDFKINTFKIDLKSDFISVLQFIYLLELHFDDARLVHMHSEIKENLQTEKDDLITTLLLQNYVQKK